VLGVVSVRSSAILDAPMNRVGGTMCLLLCLFLFPVLQHGKEIHDIRKCLGGHDKRDQQILEEAHDVTFLS
jgi:hypothetical protein